MDVLASSVLTMPNPVGSLAFSVKHPLSSFADASVVLYAASPTGVSSLLCELGGAAPRLSQLSFTPLGDALCLQAVEGIGMAVGDAEGRVTLLGGSNNGLPVSQKVVGSGPGKQKRKKKSCVVLFTSS